jgi:phosphoribosyl-AMP cyclohydrolase
MSDQTDLMERVRFNDQGLVPVITQQWDSGEVLMMAWMNQEALQITLESGQATYFSRSRSRLWIKGETSGNFQQVRSLRLDCDGDTILLEVDQLGVACHTGTRSCFDTDLSAQEPLLVTP